MLHALQRYHVSIMSIHVPMVTRNKQCHCVVKDILLLFVFSEGGTGCQDSAPGKSQTVRLIYPYWYGTPRPGESQNYSASIQCGAIKMEFH